MIGQNRLRTIINQQIEFDEFPRFSIIVGQKGSGKKTLALDIGAKLKNYQMYIVPDIKVETIRNMIADSYKVQTPTVYIISDVDAMSINAKNALLKVTEEPPNMAIFIMTVSNENTLLDTVKSRAYIYRMEYYTPGQILEYAQIGREYVENSDIFVDLCEVPGDVNKLYSIGAENLYGYVEKVIDNVAEVSTSNALKIADSIAFKEGDSGYDIELFLRAFRSVCAKRIKTAVAEDDMESQMIYSDGIKITSNILSQLNITGINKGALFDIFILDIRKEWQ